MPPRVLTLAALMPLLLFAQSPTMKQLMLDLIHPASNDILLTTSRGGPATDKDWSALRHSALTLQESAQTLLQSGPKAAAWSAAANQLSAAAADVYRAAQLRDTKSLSVLTGRIDAACTNCHRQYRPNVFPPPQGRVE